jgi:hypothetical protein
MTSLSSPVAMAPRAETGGDATAVVTFAFDGEPRMFHARAELAVGRDSSHADVAGLYWAVSALDPVAVDLDKDALNARFLRYGPDASVVAWMLVDELRALPQATLRRVEVTCPEESSPGVVLVTRTGAASAKEAA